MATGLGPCLYEGGCDKTNWRYKLCRRHAVMLFDLGVLTERAPQAKGCSNGCNKLATQGGLCAGCHAKERMCPFDGQKACGQCKSRPSEIGSLCAECKRYRRRQAEARYRARKRVADLGDYDWVAVLRFYNGEGVGRELTSPEKIELVRLVLREGGSPSEHAKRMGILERNVSHWIRHFGPRARAIGLDEPIRFCFLPDELVTAELTA